VRLRLVLIVVAAFAIGAILALVLRGDLGRLVNGFGQSGGRALVGGPFTLTDHTGKRVSETDFAGRYMLVYFGFTYCPDACPAGLQLIGETMERLGAKARQVVPIFITVDPERDTVEQMSAYVANFHPQLVGLTGTLEEITDAARAYRVYFAKVEDDSSGDGYSVDHTSIIYLMGRTGAYVAHFRHGMTSEEMAKRILQHVS